MEVVGHRSERSGLMYPVPPFSLLNVESDVVGVPTLTSTNLPNWSQPIPLLFSGVTVFRQRLLLTSEKDSVGKVDLESCLITKVNGGHIRKGTLNNYILMSMWPYLFNTTSTFYLL